MSSIEIWSIVSSIVSVILSFFAITLSVYFFVETKNTERMVSSSLMKIESQAESLQKINAKWMDRLTKYVTTDHNQHIDEKMLIRILSEIPANLTATFSKETDQQQTAVQIATELHSAYIALYFYTAQTNYWSQYYLPDISEFDSTNNFHALVKRIVDMSCTDFQHMASVLQKCNPTDLQQNPLSNLFFETKDYWRLQIRSSIDVLSAKEKEKQG